MAVVLLPWQAKRNILLTTSAAGSSTIRVCLSSGFLLYLFLSSYSLAVGVCDHIGRVHLHQVRFQPEPGFTGTGAADHQNIFVSGGLRVFRAAVHGQALGFGQNHIVLKYRVDVGCNVLMGPP